MKKAIFILIVLGFSIFYYTGFLSEQETFPFQKGFVSIEGPASTDRVWDLQKMTPLNTPELEKLYQLKWDRGLQNIPSLSFFLIRESEQARKKGNFIQAIEWATYSVKFSPQWSEPYFELARAYWDQNPFQLNKIIIQMVRGGIVHVQHYPSSLRLIFNTFFLLSNAILLAFMVFGIIVMINYVPLYVYDIRKNMTQHALTLLLNGFKIFLLFIPFFLRLDLLWAVLFWCVLIWGYVTEREKKCIVGFLILLVYIPFFLGYGSSFLNGRSSEIILEMSRANHDEWDRRTEKKMQDWLLTYSDDPEVLFTLGLIEKRQGRYPQAEALYQRAIQKDPQFSEALSNMGNVYLAQKQTGLAITFYQKAIQLNPKKGAYHFNLYRAYSQETFFSEKTDLAFRKARQLAPDLVKDYLNMESPQINRLAIDEFLPTHAFWRRSLAEVIGREGILFFLFRAWFEKIPSRVSFLVPLLFGGFLIGMFRYSRAKRFLTRCPLCGSPTYRFYMGSSNQEYFCFKCHHMFIQKKKLHPMILEKKSREARQFQKGNAFVGRFLSFFFSGFGYLWGDHIMKGIFFLFLYFVFILKFTNWQGVIPSLTLQPSITDWGPMGWGGAFILFYVFSLRQIIRMKPRFVKESMNHHEAGLSPPFFLPEKEEGR
jgi:tetratricopeptide (TPR) repeat protein